MSFKCPGSQGFSQPHPEMINCPSCGAEAEIWTDEIKANCPKCKKNIVRETKLNCLDWCRYAKECVGGEVYRKFMDNKMITVKEKLIKEMEGHFGKDKKRIEHAKKVMQYAEEILRREKADWHIVIPTSILHDVGIKAAEEKYKSSAGNYQEKEGPAIARKMLLGVGFKKEDIDEICEIIAHHHSPGKVNTQNFKVLYDADWLVNIKDEVKTDDEVEIKKIINKIFLTKTAKGMAEEMFLGSE